MADNGKFDGSVELKLLSCGSLVPFGETSTLEGLNGTNIFVKEVSADCVSGACFDISMNCCHRPRLLVLRPVSTKWEQWDKEKGQFKAPEWKEVDVRGFTRDTLAKVLSFKGKGDQGDNCLAVQLGRPQFYYDGMIELLLNGLVPPAPSKDSKSGNSCKIDRPVAPYCTTITLTLASVYLDEAGVAYPDLNQQSVKPLPSNPVQPSDFSIYVKDGLVSKVGSEIKKVSQHLLAVTVQVIAAYEQ